jgi:hypothetical protein
MSYLRPEDIAARLDHARQVGDNKYKGQCPAHQDNSPSLSISEGYKATVMYCHAGCTLDAICGALGIGREILFHDYTPDSAPSSGLNAILRQMIRDHTPGANLRTISDIMLVAFGADDLAFEGLALVRWDYPGLADLPYEEAMKRHYPLVKHSLLNSMLQPWCDANLDRCEDWETIKDAAMKKIHETWRTHYA